MIPVDSAYAMDYYSILQLKNIKKLLNYDRVKEFASCLSTQLGGRLFEEIVASEEYKSLCQANLDTFELVEAVDRGEVTPQEVHHINKTRFRSKQELQKKWFGGEMEMEVKSDRAK